MLILEKQRLPRYKTCGGAVPASALELLPFDLSPLIETRVHHICYSLDGREDVVHSFPQPGIAMFMRDRLDAFLVAQAKAELRDVVAITGVSEDATGVTVTTTNGEAVRGRYLVGADGASSAVAHSLGLRRRPMLAGAIEAEVTVPDSLLSQFKETVRIRLGCLPYGYTWIFPKSDHLSIGAGCLRRGPMDLKRALQHELATLGLNTQDAVVRGHPIPVYWRPERLHGQRTVLVGDAAGLADGLIGEGIRYALRSGRLAAQAILADNIAGYSQAVHCDLGLHLTWARRCGWWLYHLAEVCFSLAVPNPRLTRLLSEVLTGQRTYRDMFFWFPALVLEWIIRNV